mgnify:CR=1 FL=1
MNLNHLGIATKNLQNANKFIRNTHNVINSIGPIWDQNLNANLQLLEIENSISIELVEGAIVSSLLKKGINLYHFCYEVDDIKSTISKYINNGGLLLLEPTPAILFQDRLVCFINTPVGIIELLSKT